MRGRLLSSQSAQTALLHGDVVRSTPSWAIAMTAARPGPLAQLAT